MLNYETGKIDGWLAESFKSNDDSGRVDGQTAPGHRVERRQAADVRRRRLHHQHAEAVCAAAQLVRRGQAVGQVGRGSRRPHDQVHPDRTQPALRHGEPGGHHLAGHRPAAQAHLGRERSDYLRATQYDAKTGAPIFSGPYVVKSFSSTEFDYKRNDNWWGAKTGAFKLPAPLEIRRPWVGDAATHNQMLVTNDADIGPGAGATPSQLKALQAQNPKLVSYTDKPPIGWIDPCPRMLTVNTTVKPWDKKEMRWALSYAMNRQQIVDVVNEGAGATSTFIFPAYEAMQPYQDAIKDIIAPIGEFNLDKSNAVDRGPGLQAGRRHGQIRRPGRQDPLPRHRRAALHGAMGAAWSCSS